MTITIDCRMIDSGSGIGVYLRECLPYLLNSENRFFLIGDQAKLEAAAAGRQNAVLVDCGVKPFSIRELCFFGPGLLKKINKTALYYSPFFNVPSGIRIPIFTTIHDVIFPDMPELTSKMGLAARMWFYRRAYKASQKIFTVSEFSKSRIEHFLGRKRPVVVTYNAAQSYLSHPFPAPPEKKDYILFIGNIKKHKGLSCLLEAFFEARKEGFPYKLVIVGSMENFRSRDSQILGRIDTLDKEGVEFTGFVPNDKLKTLLAEAAFLVLPSFYEGFGYPPLEAMTVGTAALISDIPVFREIYGGFPVHFFRAADARDLKDKLMELSRGTETLTVKLSGDLAKRYTFKKTASIILKELGAR
jgi:glycosyltransferase involved in cell wall biosynthesis